MQFEDYLRATSSKIRAMIHKIHIPSSFLSEEDLYQEAVIHLWQSFNRGELFDKNTSYIVKGCYFHLKNYQRSVLEKFSMVEPQENDNETGEPVEPLEGVVSEDNLRERLNARMFVWDLKNNGLTKREKEVIEFMLEGLNVREIAACLKISHVRVVALTKQIREKYQLKYQKGLPT
ncbi:MAG: sigma-70 family RNA polymerase sigma factor [Candidatus Omnitrophota bacterium]